MWYRRGIVAAACVVGMAVAPAGALADPAISFVAPTGALSYAVHGDDGPFGFTEAPTGFRTTDVQPTVGVQASGGAQLVCYAVDDIQQTEPCGPPLPGCQAALCASIRPSSPLESDSVEYVGYHFVAVDLEDGDGNTLLSMWVPVDVDTQAPVVRIWNTRGVLEVDPLGTLARSAWGYHASDSNRLGGDVDRVQCSLTPVGDTPAWGPCQPALDSSADVGLDYTAAALSGMALRHRVYVVGVRSTDDFGRTSTASAVYDPVPCVTSVHPPSSLAGLASGGLSVKLSCDATYSGGGVALFTYALNGRRYAPPGKAALRYASLGTFTSHSSRSSFTVTRRLRLSRTAAAYVRRWRSIGFVLVADTGRFIKETLEGFAPGFGFGLSTFTLRH